MRGKRAAATTLAARLLAALQLCALQLAAFQLAAFQLCVGGAAAQDAPPTTADLEDRGVYVGVYLRDVSRFEQREGVFDVDFDLWAKWRGELDRDALVVANAARVEMDFLGEEVDGTWHSARWRVRGTLRGEFPLHRFPFDRQALPITLELRGVHGQLVPDLASSSMSESFSVTDWLYHPTFHPRVETTALPSDLGHLGHESEPTVLHRVTYQVFVARPIVPVALKLFLPLVIILLVALASLFLPTDQVPARSSMAVTALLSCFAFQFTVADTLPAVTYVTLADTLFLIGYVFSGATVAILITSVTLARWGYLRTAVWVDRTFRVILPAVGLFAVWMASPGEPETPPTAIEPVAEMTRHESARGELRIGSNILRYVAGSPVAFAADWEVLYDDPVDGRQVVGVERAPGVDNDGLQLQAGGAIVVTWRLREGLRWSDGEPFSSADLAFAHEISPDPDIESAETPDPRTYRVRWRRALARALDAPEAMPEHTFRDAFDEGGYDAIRTARRADVYPTLGPYALVENVEGERMVAEANPHFVGAPPNIERVVILKYESREALADAFVAGDVDMTVPNAISPQQVLEFAESHPDALHLRDSALFIYLDLDLSLPQFTRVASRRALLAAIDRPALARAAYGDNGRVAHTPIAGPIPEGLTPINHDPDAARPALAAAGLTTMPLFIVDSDVDRILAAHLTEDLAAVGVQLETRVVRSTLALRRDGGHGGMVLAITRGNRESSPQRWWGIHIVDGQYPPEARNVAYDDATAALATREQRALYPERREQLRDALFARYGERLPTIPLVFATERSLVDPALRGWQLPPDTPYGRGMERWWFEPPAD